MAVVSVREDELWVILDCYSNAHIHGCKNDESIKPILECILLAKTSSELQLDMPFSFWEFMVKHVPVNLSIGSVRTAGRVLITKIAEAIIEYEESKEGDVPFVFKAGMESSDTLLEKEGG